VENPLSFFAPNGAANRIPAFNVPFIFERGASVQRFSRSLFTSKYDDNLQRNDETILSCTRSWIERVVVGLNLCPFAERPMKLDQLNLEVVRGKDEEEIIASVFYHMILLSSPEKHGTSVVVTPDIFENNFNGFIDLVQSIEESMYKYDLHGVIQLAPFHPQFEFAGEDNTKISTFTNKSPYPMIHILRESEVSAAVNQLDGDSSRVWKRNIKLLETLEDRLGSDRITKWLMNPSYSDEEIKVVINDVIKEIKMNGIEN